MSKPNPQVGQIIRYDYLWRSGRLVGAEKGEKYRPSAIVLAVQAVEEKPAKALVCGITHSPPRGDEVGIEIPDNCKEMMGLDRDPQWIIVSESNLVEWTDPGIVQLESGAWTYGTVPRILAERVRTKYQQLYQDRGAAELVTIRRSS